VVAQSEIREEPGSKLDILCGSGMMVLSPDEMRGADRKRRTNRSEALYLPGYGGMGRLNKKVNGDTANAKSERCRD